MDHGKLKLLERIVGIRGSETSASNERVVLTESRVPANAFILATQLMEVFLFSPHSVLSASTNIPGRSGRTNILNQGITTFQPAEE